MGGTHAPTQGLQVGGRCYWCCKVAATNGHRSKLSEEQLPFVGLASEPEREPDRGGWSSSRSRSRLLELEEELARQRDVMPGYFALARKDSRGRRRQIVIGFSPSRSKSATQRGPREKPPGQP